MTTPGRLFDDNLYRYDRAQPSYWEATAGQLPVAAAPLDRSESCDVAVIGGGYTGLSAALHLARDHQIDVRVLDAGHIGWGASGRNGGFCCIGGSGVQRADLVKRVGRDQARAFYQASADAVEFVRALAADERIEFDACGDAEIEVAHSARAARDLADDQTVLADMLGIKAEYISADECRKRFLGSTECYGALISRPAFGLHPLRYCRGLGTAAAARGARLHAHSGIDNWDKDDDGRHRLSTSGGTLTARRVVVACNGFIPEALHPSFYGCTLPIISAIIVTRPLSDDELAAAGWKTVNPSLNSRRLLNYFRVLPDNRFLFGGRGHTRGHEQGEVATYDKLTAAMRRQWPAWAHVDIDFRWHGLICYTSALRPAVGRLDDDSSVFFSFGYHGNGVNMASWCGAAVADWVATGQRPSRLPEMMAGLPKRFALPRLRPQAFRLGVALAGVLDRFD